jgi:hypothetical protein
MMGFCQLGASRSTAGRNRRAMRGMSFSMINGVREEKLGWDRLVPKGGVSLDRFHLVQDVVDPKLPYRSNGSTDSMKAFDS